MKFSLLTAAALGAVAAPLAAVSAYEVACLYPPGMPDPFEARYLMHEYSASYFMANAIETPVTIHVAALSSLCQHNCLAYHDNDVLNAITEERPMFSVPEEYHNSWSRMLCIAQCFALLSDEAERPGFYDPFFEKWGLNDIQKRSDIVGLGFLQALDGNAGDLQALLEASDYHPYMVAQIVASEILLATIDDGWNALGEYNYDLETGQPVKCTANCERYKDTTGYFPRNHPTGKALNGTEKYIVEGVDKYWQPLDDNDGNGFFSAQQHVTPHIGFMAKTRLYDSVDDFPTTPDPEYDYYEESLKVVQRLAETAADPIKKQKIEFFDNKLLVINLVEGYVKRQFSDLYTFEDEILYIEGMSAGELEATIMAWREKVKHDLVRPTTVIQRWGSDVLETFGGDKSVDGPVSIAARDFQAFQRVMPHSEYPSGSSCICTAYSEFTDAFTTANYNGNITDIAFGALGDSTGFGCNPEQDPMVLASFGCQSDFTLPDMTTLLHECSESRLWAGFHYDAATAEAEKMCAGVGIMSMDRITKLKNGSTFGSTMIVGDERPVCSTRPEETTVSKTAEELEAEGSSAANSVVAFWNLLLVATAALYVAV